MQTTKRVTRNRILVLLAAFACVSCDALGIDSLGANDDSAEGAAEAPVLTTAEARTIAGFVNGIPAVDTRDFDLETALTLVAMPLSCLDRPHAAPRDRSTYLDEIVAARRPGYERNRSFYGCWDWHSAVNSIWTMVKIYKEFPALPVAGLVREKLNDHLSAGALQGELEFFQESTTFERPYGWAWVLKLYAELRTWDHPEAARWADNLQPLATLFSGRMVAYLPRLQRPSRSGAHSNTAFSLAMMLDYARAMEDVTLQEAILEAAPRLFADDYNCPTAYEPGGSDFLSPCLEEAVLMAEVLGPGAFAAWFDQFMPPVTSREFLPLTTPVDASVDDDAAEAVEAEEEAAVEEEAAEAEETMSPAAVGPESDAVEQDATAPGGVPAEAPAEAETEEGAGDEPATEEQGSQGSGDEALRRLASRSHLIGLAFIRADAMNRIAAALPPGDPRIDAYHKLAALHGSMGFAAMFDADYAGSHWIGTFALKYLLSRPHD